VIDLSLHCEFVQQILTGFIANEVRKTGFNRIVVGLSGGVDSALSAYLGTKALGAENVQRAGSTPNWW
jgi:NAD+ synthase